MKKLIEFKALFNFIDKETGQIISMKGYSNEPKSLEDVYKWVEDNITD